MIALAKKIDRKLEPLRKIANCVGSPLFDLLARAYVGLIFFKSGQSRFDSFLNGTWEDQIFLFSEEHPVPGIPGEIAAVMATGGELILPVLLVLGLFGRFAAAGLLVMTATIEFTYLHSTDHILWAFLLGMIFIKGAGKLSLDHLLIRKLRSS
ncbi:MAG: DoxX family protein [Alphaproteobacteria bacterium]|nr:DoxX family protein [Alphaproteobacteria bacterium]